MVTARQALCKLTSRAFQCRPCQAMVLVVTARQASCILTSRAFQCRPCQAKVIVVPARQALCKLATQSIIINLSQIDNGYLQNVRVIHVKQSYTARLLRPFIDDIKNKPPKVKPIREGISHTSIPNYTVCTKL